MGQNNPYQEELDEGKDAEIGGMPVENIGLIPDLDPDYIPEDEKG